VAGVDRVGVQAEDDHRRNWARQEAAERDALVLTGIPQIERSIVRLLLGSLSTWR
jgi:hypothetical protein